eukprot:4320160-Pyramimonas_sp.AAC.1
MELQSETNDTHGKGPNNEEHEDMLSPSFLRSPSQCHSEYLDRFLIDVAPSPKSPPRQHPLHPGPSPLPPATSTLASATAPCLLLSDSCRPL